MLFWTAKNKNKNKNEIIDLTLNDSQLGFDFFIGDVGNGNGGSDFEEIGTDSSVQSSDSLLAADVEEELRGGDAFAGSGLKSRADQRQRIRRQLAASRARRPAEQKRHDARLILAGVPPGVFGLGKVIAALFTIFTVRRGDSGHAGWIGTLFPS